MKSDFVLFLIGSIFPLYCAGYAGLIHIARTDPYLYGVIEKHAGRLIFLILGGVAACAAIFILADWSNEDRDESLLLITGLPLLFMAHAGYSRRFFKTITLLPPPKGAAKTEDQ